MKEFASFNIFGRGGGKGMWHGCQQRQPCHVCLCVQDTPAACPGSGSYLFIYFSESCLPLFSVMVLTMRPFVDGVTSRPLMS